MDSIVLGKPWPNKIGITGLSLDDAHSRLYAVTKEKNALYICNLKTNKIIMQVPLSAEAYTCLLNPKNRILYISLWGGDKIVFYDLNKGIITDSVATQSHPNDMALTKDGRFLFVANANSNSVTVIDTRKIKVVETLSASLYPDAPTGSTTNSVSLSDDDKTLYVANADNNCLAVFNVSNPGSSHSLGFIPTGWYPASVHVAGKQVLVCNGKGFQSMANPHGPQPDNKKIKSPYQSEYCQRVGITHCNYGEFIHNGNYPGMSSTLKGHFCPAFPDFDLSIQDVYREKVWEHDFDSLLQSNALPQLSVIRFPDDHTSGMRKGAYSPYAAAADNDLAVGRFIEHLSHNAIWKECAVFILEDDAQNGPDHVDAHRSPAFVISPFIKRHYVDHTMYSTSGLLRTIELILGLPPMSQYDAAAMPFFRSFKGSPDLTPYSAKPENVDINERNTANE